MLEAAEHADVVVMAAAVADYRPARPSHDKIRRDAQPRTLALEPTADILAAIGRARRRGQVIVGFALETSKGLSRARAKLASKGADFVVLNSPADGLGGDTNRVTLVEARGAQRLPRLSKREVAERLLDRALELRVKGLHKGSIRRLEARVGTVKPAQAAKAAKAAKPKLAPGRVRRGVRGTGAGARGRAAR
jgi:phosphopantothenoylcysteine decarboxylase/phosphopantothenate--cysteine ligase